MTCQTTLIVTPPSLAPQWADELAAHAPGLRVLIYDGWQKVPVPITEKDIDAAREKRQKQRAAEKARKAKKGSKGKGKAAAAVDAMEVDDDEDDDDDVQDWCAYVNTFDVCITTYAVLQHDLGVARPPPVRPRRAYVDYGNTSRARSPLVMCEWYRVIMDEVQMVGGGKTECVAFMTLSSFEQPSECRCGFQGDGLAHSAALVVRRFWDAREVAGSRPDSCAKVRLYTLDSVPILT